jgi:hypothetical protein
MIDKLKLWNYLTLHDSMLQYHESGNNELDELFSFRVSEVWNYLSNDEWLWIYRHMLSEEFDDWNWNRVQLNKLLELVKNIGKPVIVFESLTEQLPLF